MSLLWVVTVAGITMTLGQEDMEACRAQVRAVTGKWVMTHADQGYRSDCDSTWTIEPHGTRYERTNCTESDDNYLHVTALHSAHCSRDEAWAIVGSFAEWDPQENQMYCNYWYRATDSSPLIWEWYWTNNAEEGCPQSVAAARQKTPNGHEWGVGGLNIVLICEGACPTFECVCTGAQCHTTVKLLVGEWMMQGPSAGTYKPLCDHHWELRPFTATYSTTNCDYDNQISHTAIQHSSCFAHSRGGYYGVVVDLDAQWNLFYCQYWRRASSTSMLEFEWYWTNNTDVGCPPRVEWARAKPENGDEWRFGSIDNTSCHGGCPEFECSCTEREGDEEGDPSEENLPRCRRSVRISRSMAERHNAKRCRTD